MSHIGALLLRKQDGNTCHYSLCIKPAIHYYAGRDAHVTCAEHAHMDLLDCAPCRYR